MALTTIQSSGVANNQTFTFGAVSATGNVTGNYILGNGALLTGVITSVANINSGTSNVTVVSANGNVTVGVGGTGNVTVFATTGEYVTGLLSVTGNVTGGNILSSGNISTSGNVVGGQVLANNALILNNTTVSANYTVGTGINAFSVGPVTIANNVSVTISSGQRWIII
jgi:hypothetical protein